MKKHNLQITKTATVFSHNLESKPKVILLVHGYAQNADEFAKSFGGFSDEYAIVAPEGLSRFYKKGLRGDVGSSWMTIRERENEIADYVNYLDQVYDKLLRGKSVSVIAFSQGVSTIARWMQYSRKPIDLFISIAGAIPDEVTIDTLNCKRSYYFHGSNDPLIDKQIIKKRLVDSSMDMIHYEGAHEINEDLILKVKNLL